MNEPHSPNAAQTESLGFPCETVEQASRGANDPPTKPVKEAGEQMVQPLHEKITKETFLNHQDDFLPFGGEFKKHLGDWCLERAKGATGRQRAEHLQTLLQRTCWHSAIAALIGRSQQRGLKYRPNDLAHNESLVADLSLVLKSVLERAFADSLTVFPANSNVRCGFAYFRDPGGLFDKRSALGERYRLGSTEEVVIRAFVTAAIDVEVDRATQRLYKDANDTDPAATAELGADFTDLEKANLGRGIPPKPPKQIARKGHNYIAMTVWSQAFEGPEQMIALGNCLHDAAIRAKKSEHEIARILRVLVPNNPTPEQVRKAVFNTLKDFQVTP